jgi:hypothetical protein
MPKLQRHQSLLLLVILALTSEAVYLYMAALADLRAQVQQYLISYATVFVFYLTALVTVIRTIRKPSAAPAAKDEGPLHRLFSFIESGTDSLSGKEVLTIAFVFGILFRITLLNTQPTLSEDIYRYLWDANVARHAINPYDYAPIADELAELRDQEIYPNINHKEIPTVYPPVLQIVFNIAYRIHPSILFFKFVFVLFDLLTAFVLYHILKHLQMSSKHLIIYLWNPLLITEVAASGHAEPVGVFFLSLTLFWALKSRLILATLTLVLSFLTKFLSALLLPVLAVMKKNGKRFVFMLFLLFACVLYLPYAGAGLKLFSGLLVYSSKWQFNGSIFSILKWFFETFTPDLLVLKLMIEPFGMGHDALTMATRRIDLALNLSKTVVTAIFLLLYIRQINKYKSSVEQEGRWLFESGLLFFGSFFILNATIHPWYLIWLLPFLVIVANRAWIAFTGLIGLSYWIMLTYAKTGIWEESTGIKIIEYGPFYFLLFYDWLKGARNATRPG